MIYHILWKFPRSKRRILPQKFVARGKKDVACRNRRKTASDKFCEICMCESPAEGVGASHDKTFSFFAPPLRASFRQFRNFFAPPLPLVIRPPPSPNYKNLFSHIRNFAKCEKCSLLIFTKNNPAHTKGNNKEATVLISLVSEREGERDDAFLLFHPPSLLPLPPPFNCMHCDAAGKHWIRQIQDYFSNKTYFCLKEYICT